MIFNSEKAKARRAQKKDAIKAERAARAQAEKASWLEQEKVWRRQLDGFIECASYACQVAGHPTPEASIRATLGDGRGRQTPIDWIALKEALIPSNLTVNEKFFKKEGAILEQEGIWLFTDEENRACLLVVNGESVTVKRWDGADLTQDVPDMNVWEGKAYRLDDLPWDAPDKDRKEKVFSRDKDAFSKPTPDDPESLIRWVFQAIRVEKFHYADVLLASAVINIFAAIMPFYTMALLDRIAPNASYETLITLAVGMFIVLVVDLSMRNLRSKVTDIAARRIDITVSRRLFEHLMNIVLGKKIAAAGRTADRLRSFTTVQEFITSASLLAIIDLPFGIFFIALVFVVGGPLGYVVIAIGTVSIIFALFLQKGMEKAAAKAMIDGQERHSALVETVFSLENVRSVGGERTMRRRWRDLVAAAALSANDTRHLSHWATNAAYFLQQLSSVGVMTAGAVLVINGEITAGALIASNMLSSRALAPINQMASLLTRMWNVKSAASEVGQFLAIPSYRDSVERQLARPDLKSSMELHDVNFAYQGIVETGEERLILEGLNLLIKEGEHVGVIGKSGAGKSTLLKVIAGIYTPIQGAVRLGGVNIRQIEPWDLRGTLAAVMQEPMLISGTIRDNITVGAPEADDETVLWASRITGVDDFIRQDPAGYMKMLGERGMGLSVGQRQAIALAQALVRKPGVVVMDEPTSAMDPQSENRLIQNLQAELQDRTVIIATHKPAMLSLIDRLIVLHDGQIMHDGPRDTVLENLRQGQKAAQERAAQEQVVSSSTVSVSKSDSDDAPEDSSEDSDQKPS